MHGQVAWSYHGLGMDALVDGWAGGMDVIMVWVWMRWSMDGLVALTVIPSPLYETPPPNNKNTLAPILPKLPLPFKGYSELGWKVSRLQNQEQEQEQKREQQQAGARAR